MVVYSKTAVYGILAAAILKSNFFLFFDKTYSAITKYNDGDDDGDNDKNEDGNDNKKSTSGSGYDGPIFGPITTPRSRLGLTEEDRKTTATALR